MNFSFSKERGDTSGPVLYQVLVYMTWIFFLMLLVLCSYLDEAGARSQVQEQPWTDAIWDVSDTWQR